MAGRQAVSGRALVRFRRGIGVSLPRARESEEEPRRPGRATLRAPRRCRPHPGHARPAPAARERIQPRLNRWTPCLLKTHGFRYDSSLMGNDVPYDVTTDEGPLTEIPVQWIMDDAPLFRHVYGATNAIADPGRVLQMWSKEFVAMHRENGCFVLTCHPFISGRASRVALIEELVGSMRRQRGVWFATCEEVARWHDEH